MLTVKQTKAVALLFEGKTKREASKVLKVSETTFYKWIKIPEFQQELQKLNNDYLAEIRAKLIKNQEKLALTANSEMVKFSATKDLLDRIDTIQSLADNSGEITVNIKGFKDGD